MIVRCATALLAASLLLAGAATAQPVPPAPDGKPAARGSYLDRLDTNKDGFVDRAEFRAGLNQLFDRKDANKDGALSLEELKTRRGDPAKRLASLDNDKNGSISREEFLAAGDKRFARCDKDGDGRIAKGECGPRRAAAPSGAPTSR